MEEQHFSGVEEMDSADAESTGVPRVDSVLTRVARLAEVPVGEHVAVFEHAHEELRRALDAPADE